MSWLTACSARAAATSSVGRLWPGLLHGVRMAVGSVAPGIAEPGWLEALGRRPPAVPVTEVGPRGVARAAETNSCTMNVLGE